MPSTIDRVVKCVEIATRYPKQLLTPEADLETDLGIDSVKRVEIVTELSSEFELDLLAKEDAPAVRTIQQITEWIEDELRAAGGKSTQLATEALGSNAVAPSADLPEQDSPAKSYNGGGNGQVVNGQVVNGHTTNGHPVNSQFTNGQVNGQFVSNGQPTPVSPPHFKPANINSPRSEWPAPAPMPTTSTKKLAGKVAFITGSGRGVGRTTARLLSSQGATVIVNSFHSRDLGEKTAADINAEGGRAFHLWGSVCKAEQMDAVFDQIEGQFGGLDILICNASDGRLGSFTDITPADWERAFATNVSGHYHCAMRASESMKRRGGGSIVTMSSVAANRYVQGMGCQGVVKSAVEAMTRNLACELAPWSIRTNCVSGGAVYGDVMSQYPEARSTFNYWEQIVPDGELCNPMDLANTISFLVSDDARGVNGAIWTVDHGASTRAHTRELPHLNG